MKPRLKKLILPLLLTGIFVIAVVSNYPRITKGRFSATLSDEKTTCKDNHSINPYAKKISLSAAIKSALKLSDIK